MVFVFIIHERVHEPEKMVVWTNKGGGVRPQVGVYCVCIWAEIVCF